MLDTRALVLDDDDAFVDVLARCLRSTVREVDQAIECDRALELFAVHRHPVVVLDLNMPKMGGFEVMQRVHGIEPDTRVIIVTGYASVDNAISAVNQHAFGFLRKPFDFTELQTEYRDSFARLRGAQAQEAELASRALRDDLALRPGMGYSSIEAARRV